MKLVKATLESIPVTRPKVRLYGKQNLCLDKGYDFDEVRGLAREFGCTAHMRPRGDKTRKLRKDARFKGRRWVVERTHSWLNRFRRILIRWEKKQRPAWRFFISPVESSSGVMRGYSERH